MTIDSGYIPEGFNPTPILTYTFKFEHLGPQSIKVTEIYEGKSVEVPKTDYSLALEEPISDTVYDGGVITFNRPHPPGVISISVVRVTPLSQLVDYQPYGPFPAETHEFALDKITLILQEHNFGIALALSILEGGGGGGSPLPPVQGIFIPLSGTQGGFPVTGPLDFSTDGSNKLWSLSQNSNLFGANAMVLNSIGPDSSLFINTTDSGGDTNTFAFTGDGEFLLPSPLGGNNEVWVMKGFEFFGAENMLSFYSLDQNTGDRTANPIVFYTSDSTFATVTTEGKVLVSDHTTSADNDLTLTTRKYVDDAITDSGGLPPATLGQMLVHDGTAWVVSEKFLVDESSFGEAWVNIDGRVILANPDTAGAVGTLRQLDFLGRNTTAFEFVGGQGGLIVAETTVGAGDEIVLSDGFIGLPKEPVNPEHAATKRYVDDQSTLPASTVNAVLRGDGTGWVPAVGVEINSSGQLYATDVVSLGNIGGANLGARNDVLQAGEFGNIESSGIKSSDLALNTLTLTAGSGLSGGGNLTANRSFAVDGTVLRTTGAQTVGRH